MHVHLRRGFSFRFLKEVTVDLQGKRHGAVAEQFTDGLDVDALRNQNGHGAVRKS